MGPLSEFKLADGKVAPDGSAETLMDVFKRAEVSAIEEYSEYVPAGVKPEAIGKLYSGTATQTGGPEGEYTMYALGAEFVEVRIHARTREIRVPRIVGAFAGGRISHTSYTRLPA